MRMIFPMRTSFVCALWMLTAGACAAGQARPPDAGLAIEAWNEFRSDPLHRLDRTQPFLDFISGSGEVHIVLNESLLGWMYEPIDPELKAVLYAAFLGANMASQIERGESGSDDVAAMAGALDAYLAIRSARPGFELALFETLARARADGTFDATVTRLGTGATGE